MEHFGVGTEPLTIAGAVRQPGLELVDSNSFRTHSTNLPVEFDIAYSPAQTFDSPRGR